MSATTIEFRVTFGTAHIALPHAHPDGWLAVDAPDELSARLAVADLLGQRWSFIYAPGNEGYPTAESGVTEVGYPWYSRGELARISAPSRTLS